MAPRQRKTCSRCKLLLPLSAFKTRRTGAVYKSCTHCCDKNQRYYKRKKERALNRPPEEPHRTSPSSADASLASSADARLDMPT